MTTYKVKDGHDQAEIDLVLIDPQPRSTGVRVTRRTHAAGGAVIEEGKYIELIWDIVPTANAWNALLNQFGLGAVLTNEVTVYVPDPQFYYTRYNGTAIRPEIGQDVQRTGYFIRNVTILVRDLTAI